MNSTEMDLNLQLKFLIGKSLSIIGPSTKRKIQCIDFHQLSNGRGHK